MKKSIYNATFEGYYVMSVVLGLLLALSVATMLEVAVLDAISAASGRMNAFWDDVWGYLPLNLCDWFWRPEIRTRNLNVLAVTASVLTVGIFVRMSATKNSRTKMLQATATAVLALLLMLAYGYATRGWIRNAALAAIPVLLMVIPLLILRKTQMPHESLLERLANARASTETVATEHATEDVVGDWLIDQVDPLGIGRLLAKLKEFWSEHWREGIVIGVLVVGVAVWIIYRLVS